MGRSTLDKLEEITFGPGVQLPAGSTEDAMQVLEQQVHEIYLKKKKQVHEMDIYPADPAGEAARGKVLRLSMKFSLISLNH